MAPIILYLYIAAATLLLRPKSSPKLGIGLTHRLDGMLFHLRLLHCPTKSSDELITELQYADDRILVAHTPDKLQEALEYLSSVYRDLRLVMNSNKTEVMFQ